MLTYILGVVMLLIWLIVIPAALGLPFAGLGLEREKKIGTAVVCGYMEMWALFQIVAVIFILTSNRFEHVVYTFGILSVAGAVISLVWALYRKKIHAIQKPIKEARCLPWKLDNKKERLEKTIELAVWCIFALIVIFQIIMSICMAFSDGDDAYYMPVSAITEVSDSMYHINPYTGEYAQLDIRHALAPFPIWIAFLSRISGIHATILSQSVLGGVLILICYMIYSRIAKILFADNKEGIPYFMLIAAVLQMFGNYSFYTAETFLLTRTSQGKAVLANLVIPFLFWCLLQMGREYRMDTMLAREHRRPDAESDKRKLLICILIVFASMSAWLCSTLGTFLCAALIGTGGIIIAVAYKNIKAFWNALACALPSGFFAIFFLILQWLKA